MEAAQILSEAAARSDAHAARHRLEEALSLCVQDCNLAVC